MARTDAAVLTAVFASVRRFVADALPARAGGDASLDAFERAVCSALPSVLADLWAPRAASLAPVPTRYGIVEQCAAVLVAEFFLTGCCVLQQAYLATTSEPTAAKHRHRSPAATGSLNATSVTRVSAGSGTRRPSWTAAAGAGGTVDASRSSTRATVGGSAAVFARCVDRLTRWRREASRLAGAGVAGGVFASLKQRLLQWWGEAAMRTGTAGDMTGELVVDATGAGHGGGGESADPARPSQPANTSGESMADARMSRGGDGGGGRPMLVGVARRALSPLDATVAALTADSELRAESSPGDAATLPSTGSAASRPRRAQPVAPASVASPAMGMSMELVMQEAMAAEELPLPSGSALLAPGQRRGTTVAESKVGDSGGGGEACGEGMAAMEARAPDSYTRLSHDRTVATAYSGSGASGSGGWQPRALLAAQRAALARTTAAPRPPSPLHAPAPSAAATVIARDGDGDSGRSATSSSLPRAASALAGRHALTSMLSSEPSSRRDEPAAAPTPRSAAAAPNRSHEADGGSLQRAVAAAAMEARTAALAEAVAAAKLEYEALLAEHDGAVHRLTADHAKREAELTARLAASETERLQLYRAAEAVDRGAHARDEQVRALRQSLDAAHRAHAEALETQAGDLRAAWEAELETRLASIVAEVRREVLGERDALAAAAVAAAREEWETEALLDARRRVEMAQAAGRQALAAASVRLREVEAEARGSREDATAAGAAAEAARVEVAALRQRCEVAEAAALRDQAALAAATAATERAVMELHDVTRRLEVERDTALHERDEATAQATAAESSWQQRMEAAIAAAVSEAMSRARIEHAAALGRARREGEAEGRRQGATEHGDAMVALEGEVADAKAAVEAAHGIAIDAESRLAAVTAQLQTADEGARGAASERDAAVQRADAAEVKVAALRRQLEAQAAELAESLAGATATAAASVAQAEQAATAQRVQLIAQYEAELSAARREADAAGERGVAALAEARTAHEAALAAMRAQQDAALAKDRSVHEQAMAALNDRLQRALAELASWAEDGAATTAAATADTGALAVAMERIQQLESLAAEAAAQREAEAAAAAQARVGAQVREHRLRDRIREAAAALQASSAEVTALRAQLAEVEATATAAAETVDSLRRERDEAVARADAWQTAVEAERASFAVALEAAEAMTAQLQSSVNELHDAAAASAIALAATEQVWEGVTPHHRGRGAADGVADGRGYVSAPATPFDVATGAVLAAPMAPLPSPVAAIVAVPSPAAPTAVAAPHLSADTAIRLVAAALLGAEALPMLVTSRPASSGDGKALGTEEPLLSHRIETAHQLQDTIVRLVQHVSARIRRRLLALGGSGEADDDDASSGGGDADTPLADAVIGMMREQLHDHELVLEEAQAAYDEAAREVVLRGEEAADARQLATDAALALEQLRAQVHSERTLSKPSSPWAVQSDVVAMAMSEAPHPALRAAVQEALAAQAAVHASAMAVSEERAAGLDAQVADARRQLDAATAAAVASTSTLRMIEAQLTAARERGSEAIAARDAASHQLRQATQEAEQLREAGRQQAEETVAWQRRAVTAEGSLARVERDATARTAAVVADVTARLTALEQQVEAEKQRVAGEWEVRLVSALGTIEEREAEVAQLRALVEAAQRAATAAEARAAAAATTASIAANERVAAAEARARVAEAQQAALVESLGQWQARAEVAEESHSRLHEAIATPLLELAATARDAASRVARASGGVGGVMQFDAAAAELTALLASQPDMHDAAGDRRPPTANAALAALIGAWGELWGLAMDAHYDDIATLRREIEERAREAEDALALVARLTVAHPTRDGARGDGLTSTAVVASSPVTPQQSNDPFSPLVRATRNVLSAATRLGGELLAGVTAAGAPSPVPAEPWLLGVEPPPRAAEATPASAMTAGGTAAGGGGTVGMRDGAPPAAASAVSEAPTSSTGYPAFSRHRQQVVDLGTMRESGTTGMSRPAPALPHTAATTVLAAVATAYEELWSIAASAEAEVPADLPSIIAPMDLPTAAGDAPSGDDADGAAAQRATAAVINAVGSLLRLVAALVGSLRARLRDKEAVLQAVQRERLTYELLLTRMRTTSGGGGGGGGNAGSGSGASALIRGLLGAGGEGRAGEL